MLIDDLKDKLKSVEPDLAVIQQYWNNAHLEDEFQNLMTISKQEDFWQNSQQAEISKELQRIKFQRDHYLHTIATHKELYELIDLFATDEGELQKIEHDVFELCRGIKKFKIELLLNDPQDNANCFLTINSGAGGTESQDWAEILLRMYVRFCEREKLNAAYS